jgi:hypothetical protein
VFHLVFFNPFMKWLRRRSLLSVTACKSDGLTSKPSDTFDWHSIFNNESTLTSADLDRLLHHCETVIIQGSSYRMRKAKKPNKSPGKYKQGEEIHFSLPFLERIINFHNHHCQVSAPARRTKKRHPSICRGVPDLT